MLVLRLAVRLPRLRHCGFRSPSSLPSLVSLDRLVGPSRRSLTTGSPREDKERGDAPGEHQEAEGDAKTAPRPEESPRPGGAVKETSLAERALQLARRLVDGLRDTHEELFGVKKTTLMRRQVGQASTFRRKAVDDDEEEEAYSGPSELVLVKGSKSPWEAMRERLQDSPFIREMIKNSRKVAKAAVETDIGKSAAKLGQNVRDRIEVGPEH